MGVIVDTSVLIAAEKGRIDLSRIFTTAGREPIAVAAITASELLHGVERAQPASVKERRRRFVEQLLERLLVIEFGLAEARVHARLWAHLQTAGRPIGYHDMIIAATALCLGFPVVTLNEREFRQVPDLLLMGPLILPSPKAGFTFARSFIFG